MARLSERSARRRAGQFLVEGPQAVREAVLDPGRVRELYATAAASSRYPEVLAAAQRAGARIHPVTGGVLAAMLAGGGTISPQGLLAVCGLLDTGSDAGLERVLSARPRLVAVLAQVRDPGNAGTVIRAADAAGADAVLLTGASVDVHNPKLVRATAGSLFHLPVLAGVELGEAVPALRAAGLRVLAADAAGDLDLDELSDRVETDPAALLAGPVAWLFGNEAWGLPAADAALADSIVRVPVHGRAESLNLATAATVCLYATARAQRRTSRAEKRMADSERIDG